MLCAAAMAQSETKQSKWTVRGNVPLEDFVIQCHRGAGELAPENTIEAFELGWKLKCVPECDLRTTRDGVIVTFHDENFARVIRTDDEQLKKKGVKDLTWDELKKLDVGSWKGESFSGRRVSTIGEALERMTDKPDRRMYLDIKNVDLEQLAREVREHRVEKQVILASTKYDIIRTWKKLIPEGQTLLWMGGTDAALTKRIDDLKKINFQAVTQLQVHIHPVKTEDDSVRFEESDGFLKSVGEELRPRGILFQTLPMQSADPKVYWKLLDLGVMSFATDHPQVTLDAVRDYYAGKH
jgi:glycerophosphoryl diester phosphodiesterase